MNLIPPPARKRPAPWAIALAFALVYLPWGTTYIAIRVGVRYFPPALFGGTRIALAGAVLLLYLKWRGESLRLTRRDFFWAALLGIIFFLGGNYLVTLGEKTVASGVAAILVATTPLWTALLESVWPGGERLRRRGWLGLLIGLAGVFFLKADQTSDRETDVGALLVIGSAMAWALGSVLLRRRRQTASHLVLTAYQMLLGGLAQSVLGLAIGEGAELTADRFTLPGVYSFFHLLVFGSLVGFVAYTWLLDHVPTSQASTYAYVNPVVAILVGALLGDHGITLPMLAGVFVILTGVALVRSQASIPPLVVQAPTAPVDEAALEPIRPTDADGPVVAREQVDSRSKIK
jgi:drug/metabolite transporter (DMT)-like permease